MSVMVTAFMEFSTVVFRDRNDKLAISINNKRFVMAWLGGM